MKQKLTTANLGLWGEKGGSGTGGEEQGVNVGSSTMGHLEASRGAGGSRKLQWAVQQREEQETGGGR